MTGRCIEFILRGEVALSVIGISGSIRRPSRTAALVTTILAAIDQRLGSNSRLIELSDAAPLIFSALDRAGTHGAGEAIVRSVETADVLVVATPVYRASYTGALKHLFDLVSHEALIGKPVVLGATGGSHLHGLVTEHQLRPLLSFFGALTIPSTIYATEADFDEYALTSSAVASRSERAADDVARLASARPAFAAKPELDRELVATPS